MENNRPPITAELLRTLGFSRTDGGDYYQAGVTAFYHGATLGWAFEDDGGARRRADYADQLVTVLCELGQEQGEWLAKQRFREALGL